MIIPYTAKEVEILTELFNEYYPVRYIAETLKRSEGSVIQQARKLGLKRNHRVIRNLNFHGRFLLPHVKDPEGLKAALAKKYQDEKIARIRDRTAHQDKAIAELKEGLRHAPRNEAIKRAYAMGATLNQIGRVVNLSKQGVSLVINPPKKEVNWFDPYAKHDDRRTLCHTDKDVEYTAPSSPRPMSGSSGKTPKP